MTAIQRPVVDDLGNINVHGRSGLEIIWKLKTKEGDLIDLSGRDLFLEVGGWARVALTSGDDDYSRRATLTREAVGALPQDYALAYALIDESPTTPCVLWSGRLIAYGFAGMPPGADSVPAGIASWTGATVTVQQTEGPPVVVVTYLGATGGGSSGAEAFVHDQASAADEWIVNHNLGSRPVTEIRTVGGAVIDAEVLHVSPNQLRVYFASPMTGSVRCI